MKHNIGDIVIHKTGKQMVIIGISTDEVEVDKDRFEEHYLYTCRYYCEQFLIDDFFDFEIRSISQKS